MFTTGEKVGIGALVVGAAAAVGYVLFRPTDAASSTTQLTADTKQPQQPAKASPFQVKLPNGPAPLAGATVVDVAGDPAGKPILAAIPGAGDYTSDGVTIAKLASASVSPKDKPGKWVVLVTAGSLPSGGDEGAAVRAADANLKKTYDRVIWIPYAEMPPASFDAITKNAGEYVALMSHDATVAGLLTILQQAPVNA